MNLNADLEAMELDELLAYQQELTRHRKDVLAAQARVQHHLDGRAFVIAARRAAEDQLLGAAGKPPAQQLLGPDADTEAGS